MGSALHLYAYDNNQTFPTATNSSSADEELQSLGKLYDQYIPDKKVFKCPSDAGVSDIAVLTLTTTNSSFTANTCSYGYDDNHTSADDTSVVVAADRLGTDTTTWLSNNHRQRGQNILFIDGHVDWKETAMCGYYNTSTTLYDNIWQNPAGTRTSSAVGTDTVILQ